MAFPLMKRYYDPWLARIRNLLKATRGRPVALMVLFGLSPVNLCSEWPSDIPRPSFADVLAEALPDSFKPARQILFHQYQRPSPPAPTPQPRTIPATHQDTR